MKYGDPGSASRRAFVRSLTLGTAYGAISTFARNVWAGETFPSASAAPPPSPDLITSPERHSIYSSSKQWHAASYRPRTSASSPRVWMATRLSRPIAMLSTGGTFALVGSWTSPRLTRASNYSERVGPRPSFSRRSAGNVHSTRKVRSPQRALHALATTCRFFLRLPRSGLRT